MEWSNDGKLTVMVVDCQAWEVSWWNSPLKQWSINSITCNKGVNELVSLELLHLAGK
jgi:hypothetical protein